MTTATTQLKLWVEDRTVPAVVVIAGPLTGGPAAVVRQAMCRLTEGERPDVLVDLSNVELIDQVGLGILAAAYRRAQRHGGRVTALSTRATVSWAMRVAGLEAMMWEGAGPGVAPVEV